jgi:hypothetical protein
MGHFAVDFRWKARNWWGLLVSNLASFEGRRDGGQGQGAGVVQRVWMRVEMWERGDEAGDVPNSTGTGLLVLLQYSLYGFLNNWITFTF